jgi:hypothetical protein
LGEIDLHDKGNYKTPWEESREAKSRAEVLVDVEDTTPQAENSVVRFESRHQLGSTETGSSAYGSSRYGVTYPRSESTGGDISGFLYS